MSAATNKHESPSAKIAGGLGFLVARLAYWAPVALALAFFTHVAFKALRPALDEQRRLEARDAEMQAREALQFDDLEALEVELEALEDPIYQERVRRAAMRADSEPAQFDGHIPYSTPESQD